MSLEVRREEAAGPGSLHPESGSPLYHQREPTNNWGDSGITSDCQMKLSRREMMAGKPALRADTLRTNRDTVVVIDSGVDVARVHCAIKHYYTGINV